MKRKLLSILVCLAIVLFYGCHKNELAIEKDLNPSASEKINAEKRLNFNSEEEIEALIHSMKESKDGDAKALTKAPTDFISLNDYLRQVTLDSLTPEELAIVKAEGLEFDPDDELISDPYFCELLNSKREIEVNGKIYKFTKEGVYRCNIEEAELISEVEQYSTEMSMRNETEFITIKNSLEFVSRNFIPYEENILTKANSGSNRGNLTLGNGVTISMADIRDMEYKNGRGDASGFQHWISKGFGHNTVVEVNFSKKRRMKLRMYEQDYVIYSAIGMTVRMQKRKLRIWWRTKAEEFRFGWKSIELSHKFRSNPIPNIDIVDPNTGKKISKVPEYIKAKFPFSDKENVLFTIPFSSYKDFTMGNINNLFWQAMNTISSSLKNRFADFNQGAYSVEIKPEETIVYSLVPQCEKVERNTGREVARFELKWFSGNFKVGIGINGTNGEVSINKVTASPIKSGGIHRGEVYAAVKYDGRWKAARIYTSD